MDVVYIAGAGRSGSTLLANIIGEIPGFFSCGELNNVWTRGYRDDRPCGCGKSFGECHIWKEVTDEAFGGRTHLDARRMHRFLQRGCTPRYIPLMMAPAGMAMLVYRLRHFIDGLQAFYRAIQTVTGARMIVDSSKSPAYGYVLQMVPGINMHVVHLVRDSRGVAFSQAKTVLAHPHVDSHVWHHRQMPIQSATKWMVNHVAVESFWKEQSTPYLRVSYEDFAQRPCSFFSDILEFLDAKYAQSPFIDDRTVRLGTNHNFTGNRSRFLKGDVPIRKDVQWHSEMNPLTRVMVTMTTCVLLKKYGYRLHAPQS